VWVSTVTSVSVTAEGASTAILVLAADWFTNAVSGERATLMRLIGTTTWAMTAGSPTHSLNAHGVMITVADDDASPTGNWISDPSLVEPEAPLYTDVYLRQNEVAVESASNSARIMPFDIKVKRKMTDGMSVDISICSDLISGTHVNYRCFVFSRALIKLSA